MTSLEYSLICRKTVLTAEIYSEKKECTICTEERRVFNICSICGHEWCFHCDFSIARCPFCRSVVIDREHIDSDIRIQHTLNYFENQTPLMEFPTVRYRFSPNDSPFRPVQNYPVIPRRILRAPRNQSRASFQSPTRSDESDKNELYKFFIACCISIFFFILIIFTKAK